MLGLVDIASSMGFLPAAELTDDIYSYDEAEFIKFAVENLYFTQSHIGEVVAKKYGCGFIANLDQARDISVFNSIDLQYAKKKNICPLKLSDGLLIVATAAPWDVILSRDIECRAKLQVELIYASSDFIAHWIKLAEKEVDQLSGATESLLLASGGGASLLEELEDEDSVPIVKFINATLKTAINRRATDIHIECYELSVLVKYRIDGQLYMATDDLDIEFHSGLITRLKVMSNLDIAEKRIPQDGRFKMNIGGRLIDFRISILPAVYGENIVIRVLDAGGAEKQALDLSNIGFSDKQFKALSEAIGDPFGLILVTGPTGSGKTTTLYAALSACNKGHDKIITIEDPVEYQLPNITQIPVNEKKGLTFAKGLRSILRHDPDKLLVGEIRDAETAGIAIQSALTGHLVFSSLHANNAVDVMARLQNMGVNLNHTISAVNIVVAQRLIRVLCNECKQPVSLSLPEGDHAIYQACGCDHCDNTGYVGREVVSEILQFTKEMKAKLLDSQGGYEIISQAEFVAGETMRSIAERRLYAGITSMEEVDRVTSA